MFDIPSLLSLFHVPASFPTIPHSYSGRIDGVSRAVHSVSIAPHPEGAMVVVTISYVAVNNLAAVEVKFTYHVNNQTPETVWVDGNEITKGEVHFIKGFSFPGGPWVGFKILGVLPDGSQHRWDVRAYA